MNSTGGRTEYTWHFDVIYRDELMRNQELQEQLNKIWNGWEIKELIGEGSYGKVYRIERDEFGHIYKSALKVITIPQSSSELRSVMNDGMSEAGAREYFYSIVKEIVEEFTLMSRLKGNSNIVSYEDHAVVQFPEGIGWNIYIRMELLTPLMDYYRKSTVSIRNIVKLGIDVCSALEICGQYNIIHRDVKPENIFISEMGNYKLGDFGIAKQLEKTYGSLSRKGTMNYMAPEVYKGEKYDQTVDIYSLGLVLYRFLNNNRMPFVPAYPQPILYADKEEANIKRMKGLKLEPPCNAHGRLAEVVLKACEFNDTERYSNPTEMKRELIAILNGGNEAAVVYPVDDGIEKIDADYYARKDGISDRTETATYMSTEITLGDTADYGSLPDDDIRDNDYEKNEVKNSNNKNSMRIDKEFVDSGRAVSDRLDSVSTASGGAGKRRRMWLPILLSCIGLIAAGALLLFIYDSSKKSTTPYIVDMTIDEAKQLASQAEYGLIVEVSDEEYSDTVEKGHIISQDIESGTTIYKGTVIHAVISKGALIEVPGVTGLESSEAETVITSAGLTYSVLDEVYSDDVEAGRIISQDIEAGTKIEEGKTVNVTVSKGKELIPVPNVTGMNADEAIKAITDTGLTYEISEEYSNNVEADTIISQDVAAESMVEKNTTIKLVKSLGKKPEVKTSAPAASTKSSKSSKSTKSSGEVIWEDVK